MLATLGTQWSHSTTTNKAKNTKQKATKMSNTDPQQNGDEPMCSRRLMILTLTYTYLFVLIFLNAHNAKLHQIFA